MKIYDIEDEKFNKYGKILDLDTNEIIKEAEKIPMPKSGSVYHAFEESFESLGIAQKIQEDCFGELPCQIGYCYGFSNKMNAMEWHKCSEIDIAVTDLILLLGKVQDIVNNRYDSKNVEAFYVKKGTAIEVYSTTLHFCPISVKETGFGLVVALLKGTNIPLDKEHKDKILFRKNKWIIAHEENKELIDRGVVPGIYGENYVF